MPRYTLTNCTIHDRATDLKATAETLAFARQLFQLLTFGHYVPSLIWEA